MTDKFKNCLGYIYCKQTRLTSIYQLSNSAFDVNYQQKGTRAIDPLPYTYYWLPYELWCLISIRHNVVQNLLGDQNIKDKYSN